MLIASPASSGVLWGSDGAAAQKAAVPAPDLSAQERDILAQERALKASAAGGTTSTTYIYATGADGVRYIVGARVTITGPEEAAGKTGKTSGAGQPEGNEANKEQIAELEKIQREVIAHETAHKAAAGRFGGPVHYTYTTGPDGKKYVTGGEVPISTPAVSDSREALRNARQVMRAAMAPGDPSGQDISVAASAAAVAMSALSELAREGADGKASKPRQLDAYAKQVSPKGLWFAHSAGTPDEETAEGPRRTLDIAA